MGTDIVMQRTEKTIITDQELKSIKDMLDKAKSEGTAFIICFDENQTSCDTQFFHGDLFTYANMVDGITNGLQRISDNTKEVTIQ